MSDKKMDKEISKVAADIAKALNLDELRESVDKLTALKTKKKSMSRKGLTLFGKDISKGTDELKKEEKILGFMQAVVQDNKPVLEKFAVGTKEKALQEGVNAAGGFLVPDEFRAEIIKEITETFVMRNMVRVIPMRRRVMDIPKEVNRVKVYWTAETTEKTTTTASYTEKTLTAYKMAAIAYISDELMADAYDFNMVQEIVSQFARAIGDEEDKVITAGTGVAQPTGLTTCTITNVTCVGNLSFDNMINLEYALPAQYRNAAKNVFLSHPNNIREMRKLKDSNNRYYWSEPVAAGQPASYHGYRVIENSWLPESEIYFGDFKLAYWLGDRQTMTVNTSKETTEAWTKDMLSVRVVERIAGNCVLENALRCLNTIP